MIYCVRSPPNDQVTCSSAPTTPSLTSETTVLVSAPPSCKRWRCGVLPHHLLTLLPSCLASMLQHPPYTRTCSAIAIRLEREMSYFYDDDTSGHVTVLSLARSVVPVAIGTAASPTPWHRSAGGLPSASFYLAYSLIIFLQ